MNTISLDTQRTIMFIPVANISIAFIYLYNSFAGKLSTLKTMAGMFVVLACVLPVTILQATISQHIPSIADVTGVAYMYLGSLSMAAGLIKYQDSVCGFF